MNKIEKSLFEEYPDTQVTFIDQINNNRWAKWKKWSECSDEEKEQANLRQIFPKEVVLDFEDKNLLTLTKAKEKLKEKDWSYNLFDSGSRGFHVHLLFYGLNQKSLEVRNRIRKAIIKEFNSDETKSSEATLVARFDKPHFKTLGKKFMIDDYKNPTDLNIVPVEIMKELRDSDPETQAFIKKNTSPDELFKDFHFKDPIMIYISNNILPDNTARDTNIFPSVAMGLVKEGLNEKEIEDIMKPIIEKNFPGKNYNEFRGWVKKAFAGQVDFNPTQLNKWIKDHTTFDKLYDITPVIVTKEELLGTPEEVCINADDYIKQPRKENKWLVKDWISEGDISCWYGRPGSFKSTTIAHLCYAICTGDLAFNKYETQESKVLYLNAENHHNIMIPLMERVLKGFDDETNEEKLKKIRDNFFITRKKSTFSLESPNDVNAIIALANKHKATVIIFDSFRRFFIGKENESDVINRLYLALDKIRVACNNATIILIHHSKKESPDVDFRDMARGSGDIMGMGDTNIFIKRQAGKNSIILSQAKNRGGEELMNKHIILDKNEKGGIYIWETRDAVEKKEAKSKLEQAIEGIMSFKEEQITEFTWEELNKLRDSKTIGLTTMKNALNQLKQEGAIRQEGNTNKVKFVFNDSM